MAIVVVHGGNSGQFGEGAREGLERKREEERRQAKAEDIQKAVSGSFEAHKTSLMAMAEEMDAKLMGPHQNEKVSALYSKPRKSAREHKLWLDSVHSTMGTISDPQALAIFQEGLAPELARREEELADDGLTYAMGGALEAGLIDEAGLAELDALREAGAPAKAVHQQLISAAGRAREMQRRQGLMDLNLDRGTRGVQAHQEAITLYQTNGLPVPAWKQSRVHEANAALQDAQIRARLDPDYDIGAGTDKALAILDRPSPEVEALGGTLRGVLGDLYKSKASLDPMLAMTEQGQQQLLALDTQIQELEERLTQAGLPIKVDSGFVSPFIGPGSLYQDDAEGGRMLFQSDQAPGAETQAPAEEPQVSEQVGTEDQATRTDPSFKTAEDSIRGTEPFKDAKGSEESRAAVQGKMLDAFKGLGVQLAPEDLEDPDKVREKAMARYAELEAEDPKRAKELGGQLLTLLEKALEALDSGDVQDKEKSDRAAKVHDDWAKGRLGGPY